MAVRPNYYTKSIVEKKIKTSIPKPILKELLLLSRKQLHFRFNHEIYTQIDGMAMGFQLGPLIANIFLISLEEKVLPKLSHCLLLDMLCWWHLCICCSWKDSFYFKRIKFSRMNWKKIIKLPSLMSLSTELASVI